MLSVINVSDYIIIWFKSEEDLPLSHVKLQKLLYYCQAWHLAFFGKKLFNGEFQAWIHGPVNREIYNVYRNNKYLNSDMTLDDVKDKNSPLKIPQDKVNHINSILEHYSGYSGAELEVFTHSEKPWIEARGETKPFQRCTTIIKDDTMIQYYKSLLQPQ